ncbi:MAG: nucleotidyltransferase domain-containing protein [Desulfobacteraceae bacterium]|jgi:predicted nucleotidyltransferase
MDKGKAPHIIIEYVDFIIKEKPQIKMVYLFGSYAKEEQHSTSDVDLAVIFENIADTFDTQVELMKMRRKFDTKIEPHVFLESDFNPSNPLANEVLKYGIRLN